MTTPLRIERGPAWAVCFYCAARPEADHAADGCQRAQRAAQGLVCLCPCTDRAGTRDTTGGVSGES